MHDPLADNAQLVVASRPDGAANFSTQIGRQVISAVDVGLHHIRYGCTTLVVAGIGPVWTDERYRQRGLARHLMNQALVAMQQWPTVLSLLYGIPDFYERFGYTTVGPMHLITLLDIEDAAAMPPCWSARDAVGTDLFAIAALYDAATADAIGAGVRPTNSAVWGRLAEKLAQGQRHECGVAVDSNGRVGGYIWHGRGFHYVDEGYDYFPNRLNFGEEMAAEPQAADALLALCYAWAAEAAQHRAAPLDRITLNVPPESVVARATRERRATAEATTFRSGGPMARVVDMYRLFVAIQPELTRRLHASGWARSIRLHLQTDAGNVTLAVTGDQVRIAHPNDEGDAPFDGYSVSVVLPQTVLTRLVLGVGEPADAFARLSQSCDTQAEALLSALFPPRTFHTYPIDRP